MDARLIRCPPRSGPDNMAIDQCLLNDADQRKIVTLRFYQWTPATLSLGYFQRSAEIEQHSQLAVMPRVRRASGGGAIVHHFELTYSYATPRRGDSAELYVAIHESLIDTLAHLDVAAEICGADRAAAARKAQPTEPVLCFQRRSEFDLLIGEHKIVGSAQRKGRTAVLQHGSILLAASSHAPQLLGVNDLRQNRGARKAATTELTPTELADAWTPRLAQRLGLRLGAPGPVSDEHLREARQIAERRFAHPDWATRR